MGPGLRTHADPPAHLGRPGAAGAQAPPRSPRLGRLQAGCCTGLAAVSSSPCPGSPSGPGAGWEPQPARQGRRRPASVPPSPNAALRPSCLTRPGLLVQALIRWRRRRPGPLHHSDIERPASKQTLRKDDGGQGVPGGSPSVERSAWRRGAGVWRGRRQRRWHWRPLNSRWGLLTPAPRPPQQPPRLGNRPERSPGLCQQCKALCCPSPGQNRSAPRRIPRAGQPPPPATAPRLRTAPKRFALDTCMPPPSVPRGAVWRGLLCVRPCRGAPIMGRHRCGSMSCPATQRAACWAPLVCRLVERTLACRGGGGTCQLCCRPMPPPKNERPHAVRADSATPCCSPARLSSCLRGRLPCCNLGAAPEPAAGCNAACTRLLACTSDGAAQARGCPRHLRLLCGTHLERTCDRAVGVKA